MTLMLCVAIGRISYKIVVFEKRIHVLDANGVHSRPVAIPERASMDSVCNSSGLKLLDTVTVQT